MRSARRFGPSATLIDRPASSKPLWIRAGGPVTDHAQFPKPKIELTEETPYETMEIPHIEGFALLDR